MSPALALRAIRVRERVRASRQEVERRIRLYEAEVRELMFLATMAPMDKAELYEMVSEYGGLIVDLKRRLK